MAPTFIGVDKDGNIAVHIQTGDVGVASNLAQTMTSYDLVFTETDPGFFTVAVETEFRNFSASHLTYPDSLGNGGLPADEGNPGSDLKGFTVTFDEWHHLLLSWDIRDGNASHGRTHFVEGEKYIDETSLLYCAFDDVNKSGDELPGIRTDEMAGQNETISYGTWAIEGQSSLSGAPGEPSPPTYSVEFKTGVKADGIYIPATLEYNLTYPPYSGAGPDNSTGNPTVRPVRRIEMAELQIFAGITLDTSLVINRRAFVDSHGDPVDPEVTEKMLGRRPDVLLHGTSDWQSGANTGSTGTMRMTEGDDDKIIPAGQFTPTALIEKFEPDPSLHESTA
jgi:hypothetical protein